MRINKISDYQRKNTLIFYKIPSTNILRKRKRDRISPEISFSVISGFAARLRVLPLLASLAQIGELARRLVEGF